MPNKSYITGIITVQISTWSFKPMRYIYTVDRTWQAKDVCTKLRINVSKYKALQIKYCSFLTTRLYFQHVQYINVLYVTIYVAD